MPKLLADYLQEQQEPFALDVYLLERGYSPPTSNSNTCSRFVKAVLRNLVFHNNHQFKIAGNGRRRNTQQHAQVDQFSSTHYNGILEADRERELKWRAILEESNKQLSPVSVLEETESDEGSPLHQKQYSLKTTRGDSSTSITHRKLTYQQLADSNSDADQYSINKRLLQQTKQLLIDSVREVIESHRRRDNRNGEQLKKILGTEELWKIVCENVWLWSQDSIHQMNIVHLLHSDFMASAQDWDSGFDQHKQEISMVIGEAILEDIINEFVMS